MVNCEEARSKSDMFAYGTAHMQEHVGARKAQLPAVHVQPENSAESSKTSTSILLVVYLFFLNSESNRPR